MRPILSGLHDAQIFDTQQSVFDILSLFCDDLTCSDARHNLIKGTNKHFRRGSGVQLRLSTFTTLSPCIHLMIFLPQTNESFSNSRKISSFQTCKFQDLTARSSGEMTKGVPSFRRLQQLLGLWCSLTRKHTSQSSFVRTLNNI